MKNTTDPDGGMDPRVKRASQIVEQVSGVPPLMCIEDNTEICCPNISCGNCPQRQPQLETRGLRVRGSIIRFL